MVSGIGAIGSIGSNFAISSLQQALSAQTRMKLESLGIDTSNIRTEAQGQAALQSSQSSQSTQQGQGAQKVQIPVQGGANQSAIESIKAEAMALASKVGASVSSEAKLGDIMAAIAQALSNLQVQAANNPKKMAEVGKYQSEYASLNQSVSNLQSTMQPQHAQMPGASQIQSSLDGMALYNMASLYISNASSVKLNRP